MATGVIVNVREGNASTIGEYARVSAAFEVREVFDCIEDAEAPASVRLSVRQLKNSYVKNYDAIPGEHPASWPSRFAGARWALFFADVDGRSAGAAMVVAAPTSATLWDIRVAPDLRRAGVGSALFRRAETWALENGYRVLDVETQNINVAACRFYERQGCSLHAVNRDAYPTLPEEIQLIWRKEL